MKKNVLVTQREIDYDESKVFVTKTDIRGIVTYVNDSFVKVSGFSREELIGKNHNIVRHPDMPEWAFKSLWDTVMSGHPWRGIVKNRAKNGDHYWVRATVSPITDGGVNVGYISLRKKPTRAEIAAAEAAYKSDTPPAGRASLSRWFQSLALQTKLQLLIQPALLLMQAIASFAIIDANTGGVEQPHKLIVGQILIQIAFQLVLFFFIRLIVRHFVVKPVDEIKANLGALINGQMSGQVDISRRDEMGEVLCSVQSTKVLLGAIIDQIASVSGDIDERATQLSSAMAQVSAGSKSQFAAANSMSATVAKMTVSIDRIAENAGEVRRISDNSTLLASDGRKIVQQVVDEMSRTNQAVINTTQTMQKLGEQSGQIQDVVKVIKEIADQTNLLALNAAIEAARAGEGGRGFAVVADEVRKLAEKTGRSTQEIAVMVDQIRASTDHAITEMQATAQMVSSGSALAGKAGNAIAEINAGVFRVLEGVEGISSSIKEQSMASREIADNIESVAHMSGENGKAISDVYGTVENLETLSSTLEQSVGHFQI